MKFKNWLNKMGYLKESLWNPKTWFQPHHTENPTPTSTGQDNWVFGPKSRGDFEQYASFFRTTDNDFFTQRRMGKQTGQKVNYDNLYQTMAQHQGQALLKVNPCALMRKFFTQGLPSLKQGVYQQNKYHDKWNQPYDPGLPFIKVIGNKVEIFEGNHRLMSACQMGLPSAIVYVKYFGNYDVLKSVVQKVLHDQKGFEHEKPGKYYSELPQNI